MINATTVQQHKIVWKHIYKQFMKNTSAINVTISHTQKRFLKDILNQFTRHQVITVTNATTVQQHKIVLMHIDKQFIQMKTQVAKNLLKLKMKRRYQEKRLMLVRELSVNYVKPNLIRKKPIQSI